MLRFDRIYKYYCINLDKEFYESLHSLAFVLLNNIGNDSRKKQEVLSLKFERELRTFTTIKKIN